jgi:hypothetical protein
MILDTVRSKLQGVKWQRRKKHRSPPASDITSMQRHFSEVLGGVGDAVGEIDLRTRGRA